MRKVITNELKEEIRAYYKANTVPLRVLSETFNLSLPTIGSILKDIPKYTKAKLFNPSLDEHYFDIIDSADKAYFLGLLITDGNVYHYTDDSGRQDSISITLANEDAYILQAFKEAVKCNTALTTDTRGKAKAQTAACRSNIMATALSAYGITPAKTLYTFLPKLPDQYMPDLFRGILDGDGSVRWNSWKNKHMHNFSFCGSHRLMTDMVTYLVTNNIITSRPKIYDYHDKNLSEFKIQSYENIVAFGEWIYSDANLYLHRKYDKYLAIKTYYLEEIKNGKLSKNK